MLVREGATTADQRGAADAMVRLLEKGWCKTYDDVFRDYQMNRGTAGAMVMGPVRLYAGQILTGLRHFRGPGDRG